MSLDPDQFSLYSAPSTSSARSFLGPLLPLIVLGRPALPVNMAAKGMVRTSRNLSSCASPSGISLDLGGIPPSLPAGASWVKAGGESRLQGIHKALRPL